MVNMVANIKFIKHIFKSAWSLNELRGSDIYLASVFIVDTALWWLSMPWQYQYLPLNCYRLNDVNTINFD